MLAFLRLSVDLEQLFDQFRCLDVDFTDANVSTDFEELNYVAGVALDSLDAHVVVHPLLHKSGLRETLALLRNGHRVEFVQFRQME